MAYEVDRLQIVIETTTKNTNAALDSLISKLNVVSKKLKQMQAFTTSVSKLNTGKTSASGTRKATNEFSILKEKILQADATLKNLNSELMKTQQFRLIKANNPELTDEQALQVLHSRNSEIGKSISLQKNLNNETRRLNSVKLDQIKTEFNRIKANATNADARVQLLIQRLKQTNQYKALMAQNPSLTDAQAVKILTATNTKVKQLNGLLGKTQVKTRSIMSMLYRIMSIFYILRYAWKSITIAMDYAETVNLFQSVFRKLGLDAGEAFEMAFLERADEFVYNFSQALTLDPEELMRYMSNFAQMANSMGMTSDSAYMLSESLTMLGADISSLFNIDMEDAMSKLKSGLAGQIRPLRGLGIDISKTSLQAIALRYGIEDSIETMSAAAKVQLRYLAIMDQITVSMGDMARTINTPANQLRILKQQFINLARAVGQVFLPAVTKILPIINAMVIALKELATQLAHAVGYIAPDFTETDIFLGELDETIDDTEESISNLMKTIGGFDELNLFNETDEDDILGSGYEELDKAIGQQYDAYLSLMDEQFEKMTNSAKELSESFKPILLFLSTYLGYLASIKVATVAVTVATKGWAASAALLSNKSLFGIAISSISTLIIMWDELSTPLKIVLGLLGSIATALIVIRNWQLIVNAVTAANPYLLILSALIAVAIVVVKYWKEISTAIKNAWQAVVSFGQPAIEWIKTTARTIGDFFMTVFKKVGNFFTGIWDGLTDGLESAWKFITTQFGKIGDFFSGVGEGMANVFKDALNTLVKGINWVIAKPFEAINGILEGIKNINILGAKPFGWVGTVPVPEIPLLASGGIVDYGQLFVAREAGAELVGSFGNKTGVMNNEQIVEAVSSGVYKAVVAAMNGQTDRPMSVQVYLDGKQISTTVEQNRRRKGAGISRGGSR